MRIIRFNYEWEINIDKKSSILCFPQREVERTLIRERGARVLSVLRYSHVALEYSFFVFQNILNDKVENIAHNQRDKDVYYTVKELRPNVPNTRFNINNLNH